MNLLEIFVLLFTHWIADFVFQTHWQATNKSKNNDALTQHVFTYSVTWIPVIFTLLYLGPFNLLGGIVLSMVFSGVTFILHFCTDYYTSRLNSKLWAKQDYHNFFVSVGFDQVLHYVQIFITYYLLKTV